MNYLLFLLIIISKQIPIITTPKPISGKLVSDHKQNPIIIMRSPIVKPSFIFVSILNTYYNDTTNYNYLQFQIKFNTLRY